MSLENLELFALKKKLILSNDQKLTQAITIAFSYHGIDLILKTNSQFLINCIYDFFPSTWLSHENKNPQYTIHHFDPIEFSIEQEYFENETSQDCQVDYIEGKEIAVQRDFVAIKNNKEVKAIFNSYIDDGFFNFFRWLICRDLIFKDKAILHSSCIIGKNQKAYVFLGPSGAGKTTTCINAENRKILGDDMNMIVFKDDKIFMQAGSIGGRFESQIPFDQLVEVQGFYWLNQSKELRVEQLTSSKSLQSLIASLANVFWSDQNVSFNQKSLEFCNKIVKRSTFYKLSLQKNPLFWDLIEPKTISISLNGNSMYPTLISGQEIIVTTEYKLENGEIYLYKDSTNQSVIHRLIDVDTLNFKGDNSLCFEQVKKDRIIGQLLNSQNLLQKKSILKLSKLNSIESSRLTRILSRFLIRLLSY